MPLVTGAPNSKKPAYPQAAEDVENVDNCLFWACFYLGSFFIAIGLIFAIWFFILR